MDRLKDWIGNAVALVVGVAAVIIVSALNFILQLLPLVVAVLIVILLLRSC